MSDDVPDWLKRVEVQHADVIGVLSNQTSALAANTATLTNVQQMLGQVRQDVTAIASRLEALEGRFDSLDAFLRKKLKWRPWW
jgi:hypothetical protein